MPSTVPSFRRHAAIEHFVSTNKNPSFSFCQVWWQPNHATGFSVAPDGSLYAVSCLPGNCIALLRGDRIACRLADSASADAFSLSAPGSCSAAAFEALVSVLDSYSATAFGALVFVPESCSAAALEALVSVLDSCSAISLEASVCVLVVGFDTSSEHAAAAPGLLPAGF